MMEGAGGAVGGIGGEWDGVYLAIFHYLHL